MKEHSPTWVTQKKEKTVTYTEEELKAEMGRRLKELRDEKGMTQEALASALDAVEPEKEHSEKQIGYIERGQRKISLHYSRILSQVFQVDPAWFLCETEFKNREEREIAEEAVYHRLFSNLVKRDSLVDDLITAHNYSVRFVDNPSVDEDGRECFVASVELSNRRGACRYMTIGEYQQLRKNINDVVEGLLLLEIKKGTGVNYG